MPYLRGLDNPQVIGEHLKKRRLQLRLLQKDVAEILDVSEDTITGWENGRSEPQIQCYPKLIKFLGYNPFPIDTNTLGGKIKKYRIEHGLSHKRLAGILSVDASIIHLWENNHSLPYPINLKKLVQLLSE